jgi:inhibitor of KinA sporulation pathway (predicted exonuclease)
MGISKTWYPSEAIKGHPLSQHIILFDTEYTAWEGSKGRKWSEPWEHREIIQIAALRVELNQGVTELDWFDHLVKPKHNPVLSPYIIGLTGIEQAALDARGIGFAEAFAAFYAFCDQGCIPLFCYGDDPSVLDENCALNDIGRITFHAGIHDIRDIFEQAGIDTRQYTSGTVYQAVGAEFDHSAHNALNDVRSLAVTIQHLTLAGQIENGWAEAAARKESRFHL